MRVVSIYTGFVLLIGLQNVDAQEQEVIFGAHYGFPSLAYEHSETFGGSDIGMSGMYYYGIDSHWSLGVGVEFSTYRIESMREGLKGSYMTVDTEGDEFEFRYGMDGYSERLKGHYVGIPFKLQYVSFEINRHEMRLYAAVGVQYNLYSRVESNLSIAELRTSGYYPQWDAELHSPSHLGFGAMGSYSSSTRRELKNGLLLLGELGVKKSTGNGNGIYLGLYGSYSPTFSGGERPPVVGYNAEGRGEPLEMHSVLERSGKALRLDFFSMGIKLRYAFGI